MNREALIAAGMDVEDALSRVLSNEALLDRLLSLYKADGSYAALMDALDRGDTEAAAEAAHSLKGVSANLSLTKVNERAVSMLACLRAGDLAGACAQREQLTAAQQRVLDAIQ